MADIENPLVAVNFGLEIEGKLSGYFTKVTGIGSESEVVEHKIVNPDTGETIIQKIPGRLSWTDVTLSRGVTSNVDVWEWRQMVVDGKSSVEISKELNLSKKTIETYRSRIMHKLGIHDVPGLVKYAIQQGITSLEE